MKKNIITICILILSLSLNACSQPGPAEKAGERLDEIGDNIKEGQDPLKKKGTAEKVGESIDETLNQHSD